MEDIETLEMRPPNDVDIVTFTVTPSSITSSLDMQKFMIDNQVITKEVPAATLVPSDPAFFERANTFDEEKVRQQALSCAGA